MAPRIAEQQALGPALEPDRATVRRNKLRELGAQVPVHEYFEPRELVNKRPRLVALFFRIFPWLNRG